MEVMGPILQAESIHTEPTLRIPIDPPAHQEYASE